MGGMKLGIFGGLAFFVLTLVFTNIGIENNRAVRTMQDQAFGIGQGQVVQPAQPQEQVQRVVQPAQPVENVNKENNETQSKQEVQQVQVQPQGQGLTKMQKFNQDFSSFDKKFEGFDEEFSKKFN